MATEWRQRAIDDWPGELTKYRKRSNFKTGWLSIQRLLDRELGALDAESVLMLVALRDRDFRLDGQPKANARPEHPGVILSFESKHGPLRYACDTFDDFADNVYAIALGLEALRKVERYGIANDGQQYRGYSALGAGTVMGAPMSKDEAWRVLYDLAGLANEQLGSRNISTVDELYKRAAKLNHPDVGGSDDLMARATEARDRLSEPV